MKGLNIFLITCFLTLSCTFEPEPIYESNELGVEIFSFPTGWKIKEDYYAYATFKRETGSKNHSVYLNLQKEDTDKYSNLNVLKNYIDANVFVINDTNRFSVIKRTVNITKKFGFSCVELDAEVIDLQSDFSGGVPVTILSRKYYLFHPYIKEIILCTSFYESGLQSEVNYNYLNESEILVNNIKLVHNYESTYY